MTGPSARFRRLLRGRPYGTSGPDSPDGLESMGGGEGTADTPHLSTSEIEAHAGTAAEELHRIVREYLGDGPALHRLADEAIAAGAAGLRAVSELDDERLSRDPTMIAGLEVIVRMDGSRPSFMVRDGAADLATSPVGTWRDVIDSSTGELQKVLACVGRIDDPAAAHGFQGTGFLVAEDFIVTNRHVLQGIATRTSDGWRLRSDVAIDFGHEFRARDSVHRRALRQVVFAGAKPIVDPIDHAKLDLALIKLAPTKPAERPRYVLSLDASPDWDGAGQAVLYVIGYPGQPALGTYPLSVLEQLFQSTFGYKRLAPGLVTTPNATVAGSTVAHDATTLGGNSGSVLVVAGREGVAAGLHYGGRRREPRENWGHVLGRVLDEPGVGAPRTLRQVLTEHGVTLVDRRIS